MYNEKTDEEILEFFKTCTSKEKAYKFLGISEHINRTKRLEELKFVCDRVGFDSELLNHFDIKKREKEEYKNHPVLCKQCGTPIPYEYRLVKKFCNSSCAAKFNNSRRIVTNEQKKKISNSITKNYRRVCEWNGDVYNFSKPEAKMAYDSGKVDIKFMLTFFPELVRKCKYCGKHFVINFIETGRHFYRDAIYCSETCSKMACKDIDWVYSSDTRKSSRRLDKKKQFVDYKGGKCIVCGYHRCLSALEFHHLNPKEKDVAITSLVGGACSIERAKKELDKCVLLCSNCHREVHSGTISLDDYIDKESKSDVDIKEEV